MYEDAKTGQVLEIHASEVLSLHRLRRGISLPRASGGRNVP